MRETKNRTRVAWKMDELRSWWEVPSIAHFCSLFRSAFDLTDFDIEDLEDAFLESQKDEGSDFLTELVCKLLNGCYHRKDITVLNYDLYVKDVIKYKWEGTGNPIVEKSEFKELSLRDKVELIYAICEYRLDGDDVPELLKGFEGDNMRIEPLGKDKDGGTYWYFYGSRLYKEDPPPKKEVSKEEKRAKDKQRKKELDKKRREEKRQKKLEKQKRKALKKVQKKSKAEEEPVVETEDDGNIRRSGRLRIKKELRKFISESSESSSSSEDDIKDSSSEEEEEDCEEEVEEEQEKTKKNSKKTPARKTPAKKTPAKKTPAKKPPKKTPAKKQEDNSTPSGRPQRQSARKKQSQTSVEETPQLDSSVRRSGRIRGRRGAKSRKYDSDTEEEVKDDNDDSGHESGVTDDDDDTKSETSKMSVKSSMSKSSQKDTAAARRITLPRASANIEKGSISSGDEEEEEKDDLEQKDEEEVENGGDKSDEINEQNSQTESAEKDQEEKSTTENVQKESTETCELKEPEVSNTECSSPKNENFHLPTESDGHTKDNHMKDINDTNVEEMEVEENANCDKSEVIESHISSEVGMTDVGMLEDEKDKLENDSTENDSARNVETMETEQSLESCQNKESKSCDEKAQEEVVVKDDVTSKVESKPDTKESEQPGESDPECEKTELVETEEKVNHEKDAGVEMKPNSPVKEIDNESTECKETVKTEGNNDGINNSEQSEDVKDIKMDNGDVKDIKTEDDDVKDIKIEDANGKEIKIEAEDLKDIKTEDDAEKDIKTETLKSEINEKSMNTEEGEQENDNDEEMETEEKEKTDTGPKTTLGKHKPFVSTGDGVPQAQSKTDTRWHMVCSTLDDWVNLAEWFSDSQVRCEKALLKLIQEDFLPVLPEIIEAREKERKRRLAELDVRRSNRITLRMKEKMEQKKILADALALEEKEKQLIEEERRLKEEQQKLEDENRLREERLKAREERANRLSMREVRSRLIAEGKEIPPELLYTATNKYNDDYDSDDSRNDLKTDEDYHNLSRLVDAMKVHRDCWPFLDPVTDEVAPGYSDIIKRPMDLTKIEEKVKKRDYKSTQHFLSDFRLMFNNCKRFNGPDSEFTECAKTMETILKKYRKRFLTNDPGSSSYYQDKDFTLSVKGGKQGDKRYRPRRAASSKAMETVHRALASSDEGSEESDTDDDEQDEEEPNRKRIRTTEFPATQTSHQSLLLQEMIEMKRQREKNLAASALKNHQYITRGPDSLRVQNPQGGVTIIPKGELPTKGLLKLAATREIKRKVNPQFSEMVDLAKKDPGLSVSSNSAQAGPGKIKTIRIVAPAASDPSKNPVKETAESVKVSADSFLIIGGKNSGIKVSDNTRIVIQPPGSTPSTTSAKGQGREVFIRKIPTPSGMKEIPAGASTTRPVIAVTGGTPSSKPNMSRSPTILNVSGNSQIRSSPGNIPNVVRQHQILNSGLNSSSGIVTQNSQDYEASNQGNTLQNTASLQLKQKMMMQKKQQQQQNGTSNQSGPPKIIKLSTHHSNPAIQNPNQRSIEERLRDPNLDKVSENVVKSVNIAGDILDSYYSVFNSSNKSSQPQSQTQTHRVSLPVEAKPVTQTARSVNENHTHISPDIKSLLLQSMVNNGTINAASSPSLGQLNQPATPVCNGSLPQTPVGVVNSHAMYGSTSNSTNVITNSPVQLTSSVHGGSVGQGSVGLGVGQIPSNTFVQHNTTSHTATHSSTQNFVQIPVGVNSSSNMTPIEALFAGNSASNVMSNRQDVPIIQNIAVSAPMTLQSATIQNELLKPVPSTIRQNVFDVFGSNKNASADGQGRDFDPESNPELPSKELFRGIKGQSSGTVNFGSPLRTLSVMEALKSKLSQSPRQDHQHAIIKKSIPDMNGLGVVEKVASNACVSPNPVVSSVLPSYSHPHTCSLSPTTSPVLIKASSNNLTDPNTGMNQPRDSLKGSSRLDNRIKKQILYDTNGNVMADVQYDSFTNEASVEELLKDVQKSGKLEKGMTENVSLDEIEVGTYQFDSQTECWQMVESGSVHDNHSKEETTVNDMTLIDQGYHQSTVFGQIGRQGRYSSVGHGMHTGIAKDNMESMIQLQEGNEFCWNGEEPKQKNTYMIMIPNNGTGTSSTVTQLPAIYPKYGRVTYLNDMPQKRTRGGKRNMTKYTMGIPKDESSIVALNIAETDKEQSDKHGMRSRSWGKVHFQPSQRFEVPIRRNYRSGFTRGPLSVRKVRSTLELCADEVINAVAKGEHNSASVTVDRSMDEDNDIEQYLNRMRAKTKAFRVTADPIRTYQLCTSTQNNQSSPKCLPLKDIDVAKVKQVSSSPESDTANTETHGKQQTARVVQAQNRKRMLTKRNSYVVKKHSVKNASDNAHMRHNDPDNSLTCDEDFFASEVLSNLFPPNLGDGDSETDNVFKHVEHELFDLQEIHEHVPTNQPWDQTIQTPALNHQFINTSYTGAGMVGVPYNVLEVSEQTIDQTHTNQHYGVMTSIPNVLRGSYPVQYPAQTTQVTQHDEMVDPDTMSPFSPTSILNVGNARVVSSNTHHSLLPDGKELVVTTQTGLSMEAADAGNGVGPMLQGNGEFSHQCLMADGVTQFIPAPITQTGEPTS